MSRPWFLELLEAMWDLFRRYLAWPPTIPPAGLEYVKRAAAEDDPQAANIPNDQVFDSRFVEQLRAEGLFGSLQRCTSRGVAEPGDRPGLAPRNRDGRYDAAVEGGTDGSTDRLRPRARVP